MPLCCFSCSLPLLLLLLLLQGELTVLLREGRNLPVWGLPWQSNPWVRLVLGQQVVVSRRDSETSTASRHGAPVWNQEVQFLVEDPEKQVGGWVLVVFWGLCVGQFGE
jgi:hypothetical protein